MEILSESDWICIQDFNLYLFGFWEVTERIINSETCIAVILFSFKRDHEAHSHYHIDSSPSKTDIVSGSSHLSLLSSQSRSVKETYSLIYNPQYMSGRPSTPEDFISMVIVLLGTALHHLLHCLIPMFLLVF